jgi:hypothetical protein
MGLSWWWSNYAFVQQTLLLWDGIHLVLIFIFVSRTQIHHDCGLWDLIDKRRGSVVQTNSDFSKFKNFHMYKGGTHFILRMRDKGATPMHRNRDNSPSGKPHKTEFHTAFHHMVPHITSQPQGHQQNPSTYKSLRLKYSQMHQRSRLSLDQAVITTGKLKNYFFRLRQPWQINLLKTVTLLGGYKQNMLNGKDRSQRL